MKRYPKRIIINVTEEMHADAIKKAKEVDKSLAGLFRASFKHFINTN